MAVAPSRRTVRRGAAIIAALSLLSSITLLSGLVELAHAGPVSYTLYGTSNGWGFTAGTITSPGPDLTVKAGNTVSMSLTSQDGASHNFGVDYNGNRNPDPGEPLSPGYFRTTLQYSFVATTAPGTYAYYCYVHPGRMFGRFVVTVNQPPTASFTIQPLSPSAGQTVLFNASSSQDPDGTIVGHAWDFGDGSTGSGELVNHAFPTQGTYTVRLTVTDNDAATGSSQQTITVSPAPSVNTAPIANFTFTPEAPRGGQLVVFDASGSHDNDPGDFITLYAWDFGDGSRNSTVSSKTSHRYALEGTFTVALNVTDSLTPAKTGQVQKTVTVAAAIHDIAIVSVSPTASNVLPGEIVVVSVVVRNEGTVPETFNVTLLYGYTVIGRETVVALDPSSSRTVKMNCDTSQFTTTRYSLTVLVPTVLGETNTVDNSAPLSVDIIQPQPRDAHGNYFPAVLGALGAGAVISLLAILFFQRRHGENQNQTRQPQN